MKHTIIYVSIDVMELSSAVPPLALRSDPTAILTLLPHLPKLMKGLPVVSAVEGSFYDISKKVVKDTFLENWFEFLSFALSGLTLQLNFLKKIIY
jgi:hypothetical protein